MSRLGSELRNIRSDFEQVLTSTPTAQAAKEAFQQAKRKADALRGSADIGDLTDIDTTITLMESKLNKYLSGNS